MKKKTKLKEVKSPVTKQEQSELDRLKRIVEKAQISFAITVAQGDHNKEMGKRSVAQAMLAFNNYRDQLNKKYDKGKK